MLKKRNLNNNQVSDLFEQQGKDLYGILMHFGKEAVRTEPEERPKEFAVVVWIGCQIKTSFN
jgi:hypothetical protein